MTNPTQVNKRGLILLFLLFGFLLAVTPVLSQTTTVDIPASKDNTLYEDAAGLLSNALGGGFFAGRTNQSSGSIRRGLIAFDMNSSIPTGAQIQSISLYLHVSNSTTGTSTISLHRVTSDWGEGTSIAPGAGGSGDTTTVGDASWIHTFYDNSFWSQIGGDFNTSASDQIAIGDTGSYTLANSSGLVADVQAWVDQTTDNFGWILLGNETTNQTSKRFDSKDNINPAFRPVLTVEYTPITAIGDDPVTVPAGIELEQNFPNPFNPSTEIKFSLAKSAQVKLAIFNILGQEIALLTDDQYSPGSHRVTWDAANFTSGVYFYRLESEGTVLTRKMMLLQ